VGAESLIGAGSFVPAGLQIPPGSLVAGSPAKVVRQLDEQMLAWKANGLRMYQELAQRSRATLREVAPLEALEADRKRVSTGRDEAIPLHELRKQGK